MRSTSAGKHANLCARAVGVSLVGRRRAVSFGTSDRVETSDNVIRTCLISEANALMHLCVRVGGGAALSESFDQRRHGRSEAAQCRLPEGVVPLANRTRFPAQW